ncbi:MULTISPECIES: APC family permease [Streptomyces]|uniref:APC family permease n=1 Tax=Streptomyces halstedii TaxID=1944 RepID=A0ABS6TZ80_STRHA|nr:MULTISPECIES: APC family permease [Streptomyces]AWL37217.1 APC family permease [Streptomyces sp. SM18]MBV7673588.1 APC family permease [Streptomyces halstedii]
MLGLAPRKLHPKVPRFHGEGGKYRLTAAGGLAALSLDALTSVVYGPEAIVLALVAAGVSATSATLPIALVIAGLLGVLVISYRQVIAVHPNGGGSYAVAKEDLGRRTSLLAAASLVVDYILTVAVSLAAGAASLASAFPALGDHLLAVCLTGLAVLTAVNLRGIADSARVLMAPMALFAAGVLAVVVVGLFRSHPVAVVGTAQTFHISEAFGVLLLLKAFSAGCTALTGIEAIANAVPMFREPRVRRAQHTEVLLGVLLATMVLGLVLLIRRHHVVPREGVTIVAQLAAGAFGTGWVYYAFTLITTLALALAANTSFGSLPVLMSLLAKDNRLPHLFSLRAERPVHRFGVVALALVACVLLVAVDAQLHRLLPLFAIGVFVGFTISQIGLVRYWKTRRPDGWVPRVAVSAFGAALTAVAGVVLLTTKFVSGAWFVALVVPLCMLLFSRIEHYYTSVTNALNRRRTLRPPVPVPTTVIVPLGEVDEIAERALTAACSLASDVVVVTAQDEQQKAEAMREKWARWNPGVRLDVISSPEHTLVRPLMAYVERAVGDGKHVAVLIPQVEPQHRRYRVLENQRGLLLAGLLSTRGQVIVCLLPVRVGPADLVSE